jgi:hypothetical protein
MSRRSSSQISEQQGYGRSLRGISHPEQLSKFQHLGFWHFASCSFKSPNFIIRWQLSYLHLTSKSLYIFRRVLLRIGSTFELQLLGQSLHYSWLYLLLWSQSRIHSSQKSLAQPLHSCGSRTTHPHNEQLKIFVYSNGKRSFGYPEVAIILNYILMLSLALKLSSLLIKLGSRK